MNILQLYNAITNIRTDFCSIENPIPDEQALQRLFAVFKISNIYGYKYAFDIYKKLHRININDNYDLLNIENTNIIAWYLLFSKEYDIWCDKYNMSPNVFIKYVSENNVSYLMRIAIYKISQQNKYFTLAILYEYGKHMNNPDIIEFIKDQLYNKLMFEKIDDNNKFLWLYLLSKYLLPQEFNNYVKLSTNKLFVSNDVKSIWVNIWCLKCLSECNKYFYDLYKIYYEIGILYHNKYKNDTNYNYLVPQLIILSLL